VGASFGESSLLCTRPRAASVVAAKETKLFRVDQTTFRFVLKSQTLESVKERTAPDSELLKDLTQTDLKKLSAAMSPVFFEKNQAFVTKGEMGDAFIFTGRSSLIKDFRRTNITKTKRSAQASTLGERWPPRNRERSRVGLTGGIAFSIDRSTFEKVLGNMSRIILRAQDTRKLLGIKVIADANGLSK
jgi:hypothetical protein